MIIDNKNIHFIWYGGDIPELNLQCIESWRVLFPDWNVIVWNQSDLDNIVIKHFPQVTDYVNRFGEFSKNEQRIKNNMYRYIVVYLYGGFYCDVDVMCFKPLHIDDSDLHFFMEYPLDEFMYDICDPYKQLISNAIFYSVRGNKFLRRIVSEMINYPLTINVLKHKKVGDGDIFMLFNACHFLTSTVDKYSSLYPFKMHDNQLYEPIQKSLRLEFIKSENKPNSCFGLHVSTGLC
jgi:hypothetical protein